MPKSTIAHNLLAGDSGFIIDGRLPPEFQPWKDVCDVLVGPFVVECGATGKCRRDDLNTRLVETYKTWTPENTVMWPVVELRREHGRRLSRMRGWLISEHEVGDPTLRIPGWPPILDSWEVTCRVCKKQHSLTVSMLKWESEKASTRSSNQGLYQLITLRSS